MPEVHASAGGLKRLWLEVADGDDTSYPTRGDGGAAKVKIESGEGGATAVKVFLPSPIDVDCDTPETGARLATDLQMTYLPEEELFTVPLREVAEVVADGPKTVLLHLHDGRRYGIEFASKWSCGPMRDALQEHCKKAAAAAPAAGDSDVDIVSCSTHGTSTAEEGSESQRAMQAAWQCSLGLRVGSVPREQRMNLLLRRGPSAAGW